MTADTLSGLAGVGLSLFFAYVPGAKGWFGGLDGTKKRLVMLGLLVIVALIVFGFTCAKAPINLGVNCDVQGIWTLAGIFLTALVANQATFLISTASSSASEQLLNK